MFDVMSNNNSKKRRHAPPPPAVEAVFRIVCPASKAADVTALAGDGAKIIVEDLGAAEERVVVIVAAAAGAVSCEESAAQAALIRVFERTVEDETKNSSNSTVSCKLMAPSYQVGCVLGRGGKIVEKIRQESGAHIRVLPKDQPPLPPTGDEFIQVLLLLLLLLLLLSNLNARTLCRLINFFVNTCRICNISSSSCPNHG